ncbi:hypothetical protein [Streptomyces sp. NPDC055140]
MWTDAPTDVICWVHVRRDPMAPHTLLNHALSQCPQIEAFVGAPPRPLGLADLPRTQRDA